MFATRFLKTVEGGGLGLGARFVLFVFCVVTIVAGMAFVGLVQADRAMDQSARVQTSTATASAAIADQAAGLTSAEPAEQTAALAAMVARASVLRAELYDHNAALSGAQARQGQVGVPAVDDVRSVIASRAPASRVLNDTVTVTLPLSKLGQNVGAVRVMVAQPAASGPSLSLWLLAAGYGLALVIGLPMARIMADRITAPLRVLGAFARSITSQHKVEPIALKTGDEFEDVAGAFNALIARFDDSMRRIEKLAFRDPATDLPNLAGAHRIIAEQIQDSLANNEAGVVFVLRIERLDTMVEMIGNDRAQDLIGMIGARLRQRLKTIDQTIRVADCAERPSILARMTGADFCVLTPTFASGADAARFAQRLAAALSQPLEWREQTFSFGGRVGAAIFPRDGEDADTLIRHALLAVGAAGAEPGRARFFAREMEKTAARRIAAEREIRHGIDQRAFVAHFQPKIDMRTRRVVGAEALARWIQPNGVIVSPARFIGPAEEFGLIGPISEAILQDSCWKAAAWAREGDPVPVAVNVSPLQLADDKFTDRIKRVVLETGLAPDLLQLEITESVALTNPDRAIRLLTPLKDMGVTLALDDFGTGHSSLAALSKLPFDVVKIDQSFVRALATDHHAPAIIETILTLAEKLSCKVVAEGVETEEEAHWLLAHGCRVAQGFLYGGALPPQDFRRMQQSFGRDTGLRDAGARVA